MTTKQRKKGKPTAMEHLLKALDRIDTRTQYAIDKGKANPPQSEYWRGRKEGLIEARKEIGEGINAHAEELKGERKATAERIQEAIWTAEPDANTGETIREAIARAALAAIDAVKVELEVGNTERPPTEEATGEPTTAREYWKRYGFEEVGTGGNCQAFQKVVEEDGETFLITDGEAGTPETPSQPHTVTNYDQYGNEGESLTYPDAETARKALETAGIIKPNQQAND